MDTATDPFTRATPTYDHARRTCSRDGEAIEVTGGRFSVPVFLIQTLSVMASFGGFVWFLASR